MKPIPQQLEAMLKQALIAAQQAGTLPQFDLPDSISVTRPKNVEQGDYASPVAMAVAKPARMKPLEIAVGLLEYIPHGETMLSEVEAVAPGFINFRISKAWIREQINAMITGGDAIFKQNIGEGRRAQVEFISANPTGPLHIGRTRGAVLGDTLANLLEETGWQVEREYYFNNAGRQMMNLGESLKARYLQALGQEAVVPEDGYQGTYLIDIAKELKTEVGEAWVNSDWKPFKEYAEAKIFEMIKATLNRINIEFDNFFNEQTVYDDESVWAVLAKLKAARHIYESPTREGAPEEEVQKAKAEKKPGATWFRSTTFGDGEDRVVVKSGGEPTYVLPDIAYHVNKLERGFDRIIDIFGTDHIIEAQTVSRGLTALGYDASKVDVILHQFVTFGEDKMSTRAGNYVTLDDLIDAVGADVVRYFMLSRSQNSHLDFDFELAKKQSSENPVYYIQNAHVRCCGIFRQVAERGLPENWDTSADLSLLGDLETNFILKMLEFPEQLNFAVDSLAPHQIAFWALDLARMFHPLYDEVRVLGEGVTDDVARARLRFYRAARIMFRHVLQLMGMTAPERM